MLNIVSAARFVTSPESNCCNNSGANPKALNAAEGTELITNGSAVRIAATTVSFKASSFLETEMFLPPL